MKMKFPKIVLASVLVLTLAACGSGDESAKEKVSNENGYQLIFRRK